MGSLRLRRKASLKLLHNFGEMSEWLKEHAWKACSHRKVAPGFESQSLRQDTRTNRKIISSFGGILATIHKKNQNAADFHQEDNFYGLRQNLG